MQQRNKRLRSAARELVLLLLLSLLIFAHERDLCPVADFWGGDKNPVARASAILSFITIGGFNFYMKSPHGRSSSAPHVAHWRPVNILPVELHKRKTHSVQRQCPMWATHQSHNQNQLHWPRTHCVQEIWLEHFDTGARHKHDQTVLEVVQ